MEKVTVIMKHDGQNDGVKITLQEFIEDVRDAFSEPEIVAENLFLNDEGFSVSVGSHAYSVVRTKGGCEDVCNV